MTRHIIFSMLLLISSFTRAASLNAHELGIWSIPATDTMKRWIVIHHIEEAKSTGVYHIEVIGRNNGDPIWKIIHLVPHMAIEKKALEKNIIKPLKRGAVYPESFNSALQRWQNENRHQVCKTSLLECM